MLRTACFAGLGLAVAAAALSAQSNQALLVEVMARHGVHLPNRDFERGFDEGMAPATPVTPGSFATPLAVMAAARGGERNAAAFAFGILAGRSGRAASAGELAAAGQVLVAMIGGDDRRARVAGARVAGRVFAAPVEGRRGPVPAGLVEGLFALLNRPSEIEQLAAMDALGQMHEGAAVASLTERYHFHRNDGERALAGGALEALARIADPSTRPLVETLAADAWCAGRDPAALVCAFARERMLKDGSVAALRAALDDRSRRVQALGYLAELGLPAP